jgi:hypothetical protein
MTSGSALGELYARGARLRYRLLATPRLFLDVAIEPVHRGIARAPQARHRIVKLLAQDIAARLSPHYALPDFFASSASQASTVEGSFLPAMNGQAPLLPCGSQPQGRDNPE